MSYLYGKYVWFEHASSDMPAARRFYAELFGWSIEDLPLGERTYPMIRNAKEGIGGFRPAAPGMERLWMGYLSVPDVDQAARAAAEAGAKVLMPPTDFGPVGRAAALADPGGAVFSIWKGAQGDRPDVLPVAVGDWTWNELMTRDVAAALRFYQGVFGYTDDAMDMGPAGTYHLLVKDGIPRAGLMQVQQPQAPVMWLPYVQVADCDASADRATALGARSCVAPRDIPGVGRFAVFEDPTGVSVGIIKSAA